MAATYNNPAAIRRARRPRASALLCGIHAVFYTRSDDDGRNFTAPVEITAALEPLRSQFAWRIVATGPGPRNPTAERPFAGTCLAGTGDGHGPQPLGEHHHLQ